jgi:hypothetical protein
MSWYVERARYDGEWIPEKHDEYPKIVNSGGMRRLTSGCGPQVRFEPKPIDPGHEGLTLYQLRQVYGPDGAFTAGQANQGSL